MGNAITKIVAGIPTAKPEGIARDTERNSQKSGRAGVRKNIHLVVRTEMITRVCMNLTIVLQMVDCVETDSTDTLYIHEVHVLLIGIFNFQPGSLWYYWQRPIS